LASPLRERRLTLDDLRRVQRRRAWPTKVIQGLQLLVQRRLIAPTLARTQPQHLALPVRLLARFALLRRFPARLIGLGIRREHVRSAGAPADSAQQRPPADAAAAD